MQPSRPAPQTESYRPASRARVAVLRHAQQLTDLLFIGALGAAAFVALLAR